MSAHFTERTFNFLADVELNKWNRNWLKERMDDYRDDVVHPLRHLAAGLSDTMVSIDSWLEVAPHKVVSRIYRDTRFSRDKSFFKSTMWITFKRPRKDWQDAPAFFLEICPDGYRYGMGFYSASSDTMQELRKIVAAEPGKLRKMVRKVCNGFEIQGERYKREPSCELTEDLKEVVMRKNLYLQVRRPLDEAILGPGIVERLSEDFLKLKELYIYLLAASRKA